MLCGWAPPSPRGRCGDHRLRRRRRRRGLRRARGVGRCGCRAGRTSAWWGRRAHFHGEPSGATREGSGGPVLQVRPHQRDRAQESARPRAPSPSSRFEDPRWGAPRCPPTTRLPVSQPEAAGPRLPFSPFASRASSSRRRPSGRSGGGWGLLSPRGSRRPVCHFLYYYFFWLETQKPGLRTACCPPRSASGAGTWAPFGGSGPELRCLPLRRPERTRWRVRTLVVLSTLSLLRNSPLWGAHSAGRYGCLCRAESGLALGWTRFPSTRAPPRRGQSLALIKASGVWGLGFHSSFPPLDDKGVPRVWTRSIRNELEGVFVILAECRPLSPRKGLGTFKTAIVGSCRKPPHCAGYYAWGESELALCFSIGSGSALLSLLPCGVSRLWLPVGCLAHLGGWGQGDAKQGERLRMGRQGRTWGFDG